MRMQFKIGDSVSVLDDDITGTVSHVNGNRVTILSNDDFEFEFSANELVLIDTQDTLSDSLFSRTSVSSVINEKEQNLTRKSVKVKAKERTKPSLVVDLHIHKLTDSTRHMSNYEMLTLQLDTAKRQLEFAMKKRIQKVVLIHGVGEGVLRMELETLLRRYDNLKFYDADYKTYGFGATEIYIYQNAKP